MQKQRETLKKHEKIKQMKKQKTKNIFANIKHKEKK